MKRYGPAHPAVLVIAAIVAIAAAALVIWVLVTLDNVLFPDHAKGAEPPAATCPTADYHKLVDKAYDTHRWYTKAARDPATRSEHRHMDKLAPLCDQDGSVREAARDRYWRYYRKTIAPVTCGGRRYATPCHVPFCESKYGAASHNLYGLLDAWTSHWLPVKGNDTGTRFAPSGFSSGASKLEQDVMGHVSVLHHAYWEPCG